MPQPVKLSDTLIDSARRAAEDADRSLAGQIEHWARLGQSVEGALTVADVTRVKRSLGGSREELSEVDACRVTLMCLQLVAEIGDAGNVGRTREPLDGRPRYGIDPPFPGFLVRIDPDGKRMPGRFVNRRFVPINAAGALGVSA